MLILNNLHTHSHIDALLFYICDAGYVIANSIARWPFGLGTADRGQSLLFHKFIQSWVGYELVKVKVLMTFRLQPTHLNSSLKDWSQDLHIIFTYMQTKNSDLKRRATKILDVLFINTVHSGHWSHVQFEKRQKFFQKITALWAWSYWHGCANYSTPFSMKTRMIRMGTGTLLKNILVQLLTIWGIHHWQTSTSPVLHHQTF